MPLPPPSLVGSVVERPPSSPSSSRTASSPSPSGFPSVQHRSKSAFARAREAKRNGTRESEIKRAKEAPSVRNSRTLLTSQTNEGGGSVAGDGLAGFVKKSSSEGANEERWKEQMERDNDRKIEAMSTEERERHVAEILEQLGPNVGELLHKAREARTQSERRPDSRDDETRDDPRELRRGKDTSAESKILQPAPVTPVAKTKLSSPPRGILSQPTSRSSSPGRTARKLRFAEVTPNDVHVYQSEPSSPRRPVALLLPPPELGKSLNDETSSSTKQRNEEPERGTPEDIRRHFFPNAPEKEPALEWIERREAPLDPEPRFDLSGALIPAPVRHSLPTHLGLHHHGGSSAAGYTLSDLFLLARSSVPAQRATVLGVLSKLVRRLARGEKEVSEIKDRDGVRSQALVLGLAALTERGTVGVQAVDLIWTCVVYWDEDEVTGLEGLELCLLSSAAAPPNKETRLESPLQSTDPISSLPFSVLLPQLTNLLEAQYLPAESLVQLLSILHRFARHSVKIARAICETPRLVASVVSTFLLTPIPPAVNGSLPNPLALDVLRTLALLSRANARELVGPADALLRFITTASPLHSLPFHAGLTTALLCGTLDLYAALARYGLYSGVATTAAEHFNRLSSSILRTSGDVPTELQISWLRLLSVWMVCACDPHRTTPPHDLLWSQVAGWAWHEDILAFRGSLLSCEGRNDGRLWAAVWDALASWLEGCRINSPKAGQDERDRFIELAGQSWNNGVEKKILEKAISDLKDDLRAASSTPEDGRCRDSLARISESSMILASFTILCLASLPRRATKNVLQEIPAWILDTDALLAPLIPTLLSSDALRSVRRDIETSRYGLAFRAQVSRLRSVSTFIASSVKLSRLLREMGEWSPLALSALQTFLPGDEVAVKWVIEEVLDGGGPQIECSEKLRFLIPFFSNLIRPDNELYLSPLVPTPESIQKSTTQTLPANCAPCSPGKVGTVGLPLSPDWPCTALDHLLRSGTSPILTNPDSVPDWWNASETELAQASLSLMLHVQRNLNNGPLEYLSPGFAYVVFNCMKVFMLEHNQQQSDSNQEVFRDSTVGHLMDALLEPYTLRRSQSKSPANAWNLEVAAKGFLGEGTPFFQFYTDFVALYDAISFSHSIFGRLLLPPTSMTYAPDYRRLLWGDFGHTLRTIHARIEDVPATDLKQYFYPVETDAEMIGWYMRALIKWPLEGFVRVVAVHHIACNIWPDLREVTGGDPTQNRRPLKLLVQTFYQAKADVMKDVFCYVQDGRDQLRFPPRCYACGEEARQRRLAFVRAYKEEGIAESMEKCFSEQTE